MSNATQTRPAATTVRESVRENSSLLPPLLPLVTDGATSALVADVLLNTCKHPKWAKAKWQNIPERPDFLRTLGADTAHAAVVKSGWTKSEGGGYQHERTGKTGKDKSVEGFVWIDVDPIAILANKYNNLRSCHTLDGEYDYRVGNIAHLYCPYMISVFAGASDPAKSESLVESCSKVTGKPLVIGSKSAKIRDFQATANVYFLRDMENRPYLYVPRIYDSCAEKPWSLTILNFLAERCKPHGIGIAVGENILRDLTCAGGLCEYDLPVKSEQRGYGGRVYKTYHRFTELRSPEYTFGTGVPQCVTYYGDGICYGLSNETNGMVAYTELATAFLLAEGDGKDDFVPKRGSGTLREAKLTASYPCAVLGTGYGISSFWRVAGTDERVYRRVVQEAAKFCGHVFQQRVNDLPRLGQLTSLVAVVESEEARQIYFRDTCFANRVLQDNAIRERGLRLIPRVPQFGPLFADEWNTHKQRLLARHDDTLVALRKRKASAATFLRDLGFVVQEADGEKGQKTYHLPEGQAPPAELAALLL